MKKKLKMFIVRKYVLAESIGEVLRKERRIKPDDVWLDDEWKKNNPEVQGQEMGFKK